MIKLFKYEGYKLTVEPEALLLKPFKKLWERDKSENKTKALEELGFIYFFCDPRSDYQYLIDQEERMQAIIDGEGLSKNWKPDKHVLAAMEFYDSFKSTAALLLEDTRAAIGKLREMLLKMDLMEKDDKGKPVYAINTFASAIKMIPGLVKDLDEAERALNKEYAQSGRMRGQGEKTIMEDSLHI